MPVALSRHHSLAEWLAGPLSAVAVAAMAVWLVLIDRAAPVVFEPGQSSITPAQAAPGAKLHVHFVVHVRRVCEGVLRRDIVDSAGGIHSYVAHDLRIPVRGGRQVVDIDFNLPVALPPGDAIYRASLIYHDCGFSSRFEPLTVYTPELAFRVEAPR